MTSGKSVALVQSRAAPSTVTRATDFPAVINVGYCPRVRAITNTKCVVAAGDPTTVTYDYVQLSAEGNTYMRVHVFPWVIEKDSLQLE